MFFKKIFLFSGLILTILLFPEVLSADDNLTHIRLKTDFNIWKVDLNRAKWVNEYPKLLWQDMEVRLPEYMDPEFSESVTPYLEDKLAEGIDYSAVKRYLEKVVAPEIHRDKQDVTIGLDEKGDVVFDGFAFSGQEIDYKKAFYLIKDAFLKKEEDVRVPIKTIPPVITVQSQELIEKGITDLLATGETDFSGSPYNRRSNIRVGLASFSGTLVEPGQETGAGEILGYVGASTGYLPELVIKGDKTIPEYGGGLCQVSTTIYRSLLFAGLPITERQNHSYAVSYYDPQGLDATIYPPSVDLKFINDTPNHILIQTTTVGNKAYSNIYGAKIDRYVYLIGPWYYNYRRAPSAKTEYTDQLAPGKKEIMSGHHNGFEASWYRRISYADESKEDVIEHIYSRYAARGIWIMIGEDKPVASEDGT